MAAIGGTAFVLLLVLGAAFGMRSRGEPVPARQAASKAGMETARARPVFGIEEIDGIAYVTDAVAAHVRGEATVEPAWAGGGEEAAASLDGSVIRAAVLPHHTLAGPKLWDLWSDIADHAQPSVIVVISPNHENLGDAAVQTTHGVWTTPFGTVGTDDGLVDRLVSLGIAGDEEASFVNEHGIGTHAPYLATLFPGTPIVPIIAKSTADADRARSLALVLQQILPDDALVVSSVDFAHYLPQSTTDAMDAETLALVAGRRYDEIERLHSDHLDTPFALISYLVWNDRNGYASDLVWQQTSHRILGDPSAPGTSYLVFFSHSKEELPTLNDSTTQRLHDPITLSVVGDLMLGRAVASSLARTTVTDAFAPAAAVTAGSDIGFGNLESVLTASTADTGKSIFFKGDPARVDVLKLLGLTHLSVANNHVDDYGHAGWAESVQHLRDAGLVPIGDDHNVQAPVTTTVRGKTFVFLAYEDLIRAKDTETIVAEIREADTLGDVMIVSFHWGVEYAHTPTSRQSALAHAAIDAGADLVIGHHPHVLQGIETYGDGLILYSLGNFVFDQIGTDENESVVAKLAWNADGTRTLELVPMRIVRTFPRPATDEESEATLERIASWSTGISLGKMPIFW